MKIIWQIWLGYEQKVSLWVRIWVPIAKMWKPNGNNVKTIWKYSDVTLLRHFHIFEWCPCFWSHHLHITAIFWEKTCCPVSLQAIFATNACYYGDNQFSWVGRTCFRVHNKLLYYEHVGLAGPLPLPESVVMRMTDSLAEPWAASSHVDCLVIPPPHWEINDCIINCL